MTSLRSKLRSIKTGSPEWFLIVGAMAMAMAFLVNVIVLMGLPTYFLAILAVVWIGGGMAMDRVERGP